MLKEEIQALFSQDKRAMEENNISYQLLCELDDFILDSGITENTISQEAYGIYKKFVTMKQEAPESMKKELFRVMKEFIREKKEKAEYLDALLLDRFLVVKSILTPDTYMNIAEILLNLGEIDLSIEFLKLYDKKETNLPLKYLSLANFYNLQLQEYKTAIYYYEKYLTIDETKSVVYTILANLYQKAYGDISLKDQILYFEHAYRLKPNDRLILHSLAFGYEKLGNTQKANSFYQELLKNNPTEIDYYNYGAFLIKAGEFELGHKYFTHRFNINDKNLKYPIEFDQHKRWDLKSNIMNKTLLVHYEQGFGDTFMYCRFVPLLKDLASRIIFVVQKEVYDLIKNSPIISENIEIIPSGGNLQELDYDYHMALLDAPYALNTNCEKLPLSKGYLEVSNDKIKNYKKDHLKKSKKLKVGIAYHGDKNANYNGRDIEFSRFNKLFDIDKIEIYTLTLDEENNPNTISLAHTFNDFTDTACAIKNMDLIISTDNVILNLAGALGVKSYGLFNKYTNYRWFKLEGDNVGWYDSVKPLQVEDNNCWGDVFLKLINLISEETKIK